MHKTVHNLLPTLFLLLILAFISIIQCGTMQDNVRSKCEKNGSINLMLDLPDVTPDLKNAAPGQDFTEELVQSLKTKTSKVQSVILETLQLKIPEIKKSQISNYWIENRIFLRNVSCNLLDRIACIPYPFYMRPENIMSIFDEKISTESLEGRAVEGESPSWGIEKVNAAKVWPINKGKGVTVGSINTGVRVTHEALKQNYRGDSNYGYLDGFTNTTNGGPKDENGHGTHSIGIVCGRGQIGVAPEAIFFACKGCDNDFNCYESALVTCAQFLMCPYQTVGGVTKQDCSKRPRVADCGWGGSATHYFFNGVIRNWGLANIIPVFPVGRFGKSGCFTVGSPAEQNGVISVGGTNNDDDDSAMADTSYGPSNVNHKIKPDLVAPGNKIHSSYFNSDDEYIGSQGNCHASPFVSGTVALLISKKPSITFDEVYKALTTTTVQRTGINKNDTCSCTAKTVYPPTCGAETAPWPNNLYGYGRLDVKAAFDSV